MVTGPPTVTPITSPEPDTVATALFEELHVTTRPVNTAPEASRVVAESFTTANGVKDGDAGDTLTVATGGGVTVTIAEPSCPSLEATIVTGPPTVSAVTRPDDETVATAVFVDVHVTVRFARLLPWASFGCAVSCVVCPTTMVLAGGVTATDATGAGGPEPSPPQAAATVRQAASPKRRLPVRRRSGELVDWRPLIDFRGAIGPGVGS